MTKSKTKQNNIIKLTGNEKSFVPLVARTKNNFSIKIDLNSQRLISYTSLAW